MQRGDLIPRQAARWASYSRGLASSDRPPGNGLPVQRDHRQALARAARSLDISGPAFDRDNICWALELAGAACAAIAPKSAAQLLGAAEALREYLGQQLSGLEFKQHKRALAHLPDREQAFAAGRRLALELAHSPKRVTA